MRLATVAALLALLWSPAQAQDRTQYVLAISWQPAFCETRPDKPECESQTADRFDASHFALHGLWPQPRSRDYCGVDEATVRADKDGDWSQLPAPELPADLWADLQVAMPGTQSALERHEWIKHGTCYEGDAEAYFADSLDMLAAINDSAVAELFAASIGKRITQTEIRAAFDAAFGPGAGERVRLSCADDDGRRLISELTIGLTGDIQGPASIADRLLEARPTDGGCDGGVVDAVGLQ
nr:ribonuclease [uncultured Devosia sp.]